MHQIGVEEAPHPGVKCTNREPCLSNEKNCPCEIQEFLYDMILFVKPSLNLECMYMMPLGKDFFCASSMRGEIYERFGRPLKTRRNEHASPAGMSPR